MSHNRVHSTTVWSLHQLFLKWILEVASSVLLLQHLSILGLDQNLHSAEYNKTNSATCICIVTQLAIVGLHMQREPFVQKSISLIISANLTSEEKTHLWFTGSIFLLLHKVFCPLSITQLYKEQKYQLLKGLLTLQNLHFMPTFIRWFLWTLFFSL